MASGRRAGTGCGALPGPAIAVAPENGMAGRESPCVGVPPYYRVVRRYPLDDGSVVKQPKTFVMTDIRKTISLDEIMKLGDALSVQETFRKATEDLVAYVVAYEEAQVRDCLERWDYLFPYVGVFIARGYTHSEEAEDRQRYGRTIRIRTNFLGLAVQSSSQVVVQARATDEIRASVACKLPAVGVVRTTYTIDGPSHIRGVCLSQEVALAPANVLPSKMKL